MAATCHSNFNAAILLFGTVGNSLSSKCSEKAALILATLTAKLSSEVQKYE